MKKIGIFLNGTLFNTTIEIDVDISPLGTTTSIINFSKTFTKKIPRHQFV